MDIVYLSPWTNIRSSAGWTESDPAARLWILEYICASTRFVFKLLFYYFFKLYLIIYFIKNKNYYIFYYNLIYH
jgi:hypothetical protein